MECCLIVNAVVLPCRWTQRCHTIVSIQRDDRRIVHSQRFMCVQSIAWTAVVAVIAILCAVVFGVSAPLHRGTAAGVMLVDTC